MHVGPERVLDAVHEAAEFGAGEQGNGGEPVAALTQHIAELERRLAGIGASG